MFDKKIVAIDDYYLIIINSKTNNWNISFEMHISSKDAKEFSIPINKYISGSFNLDF